MMMICWDGRRKEPVVLTHLQLQRVDWRGAVIRDTEIAFCNMQGADLRGAVFHNVYFMLADLISAKVDRAQFIDCTFDNTSLDRCIGTPEVIDAEVKHG